MSKSNNNKKKRKDEPYSDKEMVQNHMVAELSKKRNKKIESLFLIKRNINYEGSGEKNYFNNEKLKIYFPFRIIQEIKFTSLNSQFSEEELNLLLNLKITDKSNTDKIMISSGVLNKINNYKITEPTPNNPFIPKLLSSEEAKDFGKLSTVDEKLIEELLEKDPKISLEKLLEIYNQKNLYQVIISKETLRNFIKNNMNYRYIKLKNEKSFKITNRFYNEIFVFLKRFLFYSKNDYLIIYTDESHFETKFSSVKGWYKKKDQYFDGDAHYFSQLFDYRFSIILSCSNEKILYYEINENNINEDCFLNYVKNLYEIFLKDDKQKLVLYFDNAKIHTGQKILQYLIDKNINAIYGVEYLPEFDFCEYIFGKMKNEYYKNKFEKKVNINNNITLLQEEVINFIKSVIEKLNNKKNCIRRLYNQVVEKMVESGEYINKNNEKMWFNKKEVKKEK